MSEQPTMIADVVTQERIRALEAELAECVKKLPVQTTDQCQTCGHTIVSPCSSPNVRLWAKSLAESTYDTHTIDYLHGIEYRIKKMQTELTEYREAVRVLAKSISGVQSDMDWPELTSSMRQGLFCGVEDRDIRDRYDGAAYGYEDALERCAEFIKNATEDCTSNPIARAAIEGSST